MGSKQPKRRWRDAPSPCIDVCKYPDGGFCKGCGMLKKEKKRWKRLDGRADRQPFLETLLERLTSQGEKRVQRWVKVYSRKCDKKSVPNPLEKLDLP
ncbi:MAG: DUF1289 domain-containing protein [Pseudomonadota bacterium]